MIKAKIYTQNLENQLQKLILRLENPAPLYKKWGTAVLLKARSNARAKGGKNFWRKEIAEKTRLHSVSKAGAIVECFNYIGTHKQKGGRIRAKNKAALTIPIHPLAYGNTVGELKTRGIEIVKVGKSLGTTDEKGVYTPLFALCKQTKKQAKEPWWPVHAWVIKKGLEYAKEHISN